MSFTDTYARFRGSRGFLYFLCGCIACSVLAHRLFGFDPDWGITNLSLSMEASVSVALLIMANDKQEVAQQKQLEYMLHLLEANRDFLAQTDGHATGGIVAAHDPA